MSQLSGLRGLFVVLSLLHELSAFDWEYYPPCAQPQLGANAPSQCDTNNIAGIECLCGSTSFLSGAAKDIWLNCGCDVLEQSVAKAAQICSTYSITIALNETQMLAAGDNGTQRCVDPSGFSSSSTIPATSSASTTATASATATSSAQTTQPANTSKPSLTAGAGAGIGIGVALLLVLVALSAFVLRRRRKRRAKKPQPDLVLKPELDSEGVQQQLKWPTEVEVREVQYTGTHADYANEMSANCTNLRFHELDSRHPAVELGARP